MSSILLSLLLLSTKYIEFVQFPLIRYIILEIAFSGQNLLISRSIFYNYGKVYASHIYNTLVSLRESLSVFNDVRSLVISLKELNTIKRQIDSINYMINHCLDILNKIKNKFHQLTIDQQLFFNNLNYLKESINSGNLIKFIDETIEIIEKNGKKYCFENISSRFK